MTYIYNQNLSTERYTIQVDTLERYGFFERNSDGAGGGLWFDVNNELIDYDGVFQLSREVVKALRAAGYHLDETHDPDPAPAKVSLERRRHP